MDIDTKIRMMYAALGEAVSTDLSKLKPEVTTEGDVVHWKMRFGGNQSEIELLNLVELLVNNIAKLKDLLKAWCRHNSKPFRGDTLINSNQSVALIHDLWNVNKHTELSTPPRSGVNPKLGEVRKALRITAEPGTGWQVYSFLPTGKIDTHNSTSQPQHVIDATIYDEHGNRVADLAETCESAVNAWIAEFKNAGITLPVT